MPDIIPIIIESETGKDPFGAKGIGEPSFTATVSAILNAINNAIGKRIKEIPATPEKVYFSIKDIHDTNS